MQAGRPPGDGRSPGGLPPRAPGLDVEAFMILVTGANGYVGAHLVARLRGDGAAVRALVRRGCPEDEKAFLRAAGAELVEAEIEEAPLLSRALSGVETVVHLLGSIERPRSGGYRGMHTAKTAILVGAFRDAAAARADRGGRGGGRVVYLSALGASASAANEYSRTKGEAEERIARSGLGHVIVRSSLIFGRETGGRDSKIVMKLAGLAASGRPVPLVGGGRNRLQPIYIADLVSCLRAAIAAEGRRSEVWDVGGPEVLTLREVAGKLMRMLGNGRGVVGIPYPLAYALAWCARLARAEGRLNLEQVRMSRHDAVCGVNAAYAACGGRLTSFDAGMQMTVRKFGAGALTGGARR